MTEVLNIIKQLQGTNSRIEKEQILMVNKNNQLLKDILQFVYDPFVLTGISKKKINKKLTGMDVCNPLKDIYDALNYLKYNNTGKDTDVLYIQDFINSQNQELRDFVTQIVTKDLSIGCDSKTLNKLFGENFISTFDVMLAKSYWDNESKVKDKFIITQKLDGNRCVLIKENGNIKMLTRQGQLYEGLTQIINDAIYLPNDFVYDGELIALNPDNLNSADLYRKTTSIVRKDGIKSGIIFHVFDMLPVDDFKKGYCKNSCSDRKIDMHLLIKNLQWIQEVPMLYVGNDKTQIIYWIDKMVAEGHEGIMVNIASAGYSCKRTTDILKVKRMQSADLTVLGFEEGDGRLKGTLGRMNVNYKGNSVGVGSGYSDSDRTYIWNNQSDLIGKIAEIQYFEESTNQKDNNAISLRFPVFKGFRDDKTEESYY